MNNPYRLVRRFLAIVLVVCLVFTISVAIRNTQSGEIEESDEFSQLEISLLHLATFLFYLFVLFSAFALVNAILGLILRPIVHIFNLIFWSVAVVIFFGVYSTKIPGLALVAPEDVIQLCAWITLLGIPIFTFWELAYSLALLGRQAIVQLET